MVVRHCVFTDGLGRGEVDVHPAWNSPYASGRALELYECTFANPVDSSDCVIELYAGSGVIFNNTASGYRYFIRDSPTSWNPDVQGPKDFYIWNNNIGGMTLESGPMEPGVHYFLYKPDWYTPYLYPHPLTMP